MIGQKNSLIFFLFFTCFSDITKLANGEQQVNELFTYFGQRGFESQPQYKKIKIRKFCIVYKNYVLLNFPPNTLENNLLLYTLV